MASIESKSMDTPDETRSPDKTTTAVVPNGALPRTQLAEPTCWWPFYDRAFHLALAIRRARAGAGELNWSPLPPSA